MAIDGKDIIKDDALDNHIAQLKEILKLNEQINAQIIKTAKASKTASTKVGSGKEAKGIRDLTKALSESELVKRAALKIDKEKQKLDIQLKALNSDKIQQNEELKRQVRDQAKTNKELAESTRKLVGTEEKLIAANKKLLAERKKLDTSTAKGQKRLKALNSELDRNNKILEKNSDRLGKQRIGIGRYSKAIGGLRSGLAQLGLAFGVFTLIKDSFNIIKDFDQAQANLASILGVTADQMSVLTEQAKELGATTRFTATEVSSLQKEYAKLGFTQKEIENVTEATLELAAAAGTDLATAAEVTGATLRAFGLDTSETQRVVDVMSKSFSSSSLDMEKFATAMRSVAPVAKNAGLSIERTTALLGTLTDRGIDASTAGTGLRNIFLELAKRGITFEEAMLQINEATDKNAKSLELFGKRGAVVGTILAETGADVSILEEKLNNAGGAAKEMADTQLDTLSGAIALLRSAWEGLILKFEEGSDATDFLKNIIKFLAENLVEIVDIIIKLTVAFGIYKTVVKATTLANKLLGKSLPVKSFGLLGLAVAAVVFIVLDLIDSYKNAWTEGKVLEDVTKKVNEAMAEEVAELDVLFISLAKTTKGTKARKKELDDVNKKYGLTLQNLSDENEFVRQLTGAYNDLIAQLTERITIEVIGDELRESFKDLRALQREIKKFEGTGLVVEALESEEDKLQKDIRTLQDELLRLQKPLEKALGAKGAIRTVIEEEIEEECPKGFHKDKNGKCVKNRDKKAEVVDLKKKELDELLALQRLQTLQLENDLIDQGKKQEEITEEMTLQRVGFLVDQLNLIRKLYGDETILFQKTLLELNRLSKEAADEVVVDVKKAVEEIEDALSGIGEGVSKDADKANKERIKQLKKFRDESLAIIKEITDGLSENIDKRISERQREIDASTSEVERLKDLAAQGNTDAAESIKAEKIAIAKEKLEIEALEKKKRNLLITVVALERASQLIGSGDGNPFKNAGAGISDFLAGLPQFYKGTNTTVADALGQPVMSGRDGYVVRVDGGEKILNPKQAALTGSMSTDEITRAALAYQNNLVSTRAIGVTELQAMTDTNIVKELQANTKAIKNMEFPTSTYDQETGKEIIRKGNNVTTYHHKPSQLKV